MAQWPPWLRPCQDIFKRLETEANLLQNVITRSEPWVFEYDSKTKRLRLKSLQFKVHISQGKSNKIEVENQGHAECVL